MTKRSSTQVNSDSLTPAPQLNNGKATSNTGLKDKLNDRKTKFNAPPLSTQGDPENPRPQQTGSRLRAKVTAIAIAVGMLPVIAVGCATYYFGTRAITEQATSRQAGTMGLAEAELIQQRQLELLAALLAGTGATALASGAIAAFWINRLIRSEIVTAAATTVQEAGQLRTVRTKLFTDVVYQIRASLNKEDILKAAVEETRKAIAADRVLVYSLDENSQETVVAESVVTGLPRALGAIIKDPCFGARYTEKYQDGRVHAIDDIYKENLSPCYLEQLEPFAVRANLVAPLLNEEKLIGLLIAHQCSEPRVWQQSEIDLFTQIATQVGFALDNAKLLRRVQMSQDAEAVAHELRQEKAALQQQISELVRDSEAAFRAFSTEASRQAEVVTDAIAQIQAIADSARSMAANAQKAELQMQQTSLAVQAGHKTVNRTVDGIAAFQETSADAAVKVKHLGQAAQKFSEFMSLSKNLVAQMNHQAINATIGAGRAGDAAQESVIAIAEAVRSLTQQLTRATTDIEPLVAELETEADTLADAMETATEQVVARMELTQETRQNLNQIATMSAQISTLVSSIALSAVDQAEKSTEASQTVLEAAKLANHTSKQSTTVVDYFTKLATVCQEL